MNKSLREGHRNRPVLYIKNMVCTRCILVVRQELERVGLTPVQVNLGEAELAAMPGTRQISQLSQRLEELGFELLDDRRKKEIERIKNLLTKKVQEGALEEHFVISVYLGEAIRKDYPALSRLFSEVEGITIEQYFILQKIEKVKEWLAYGELTLSEIAWKLGYSSVAHLSAQFRKVTGMTPSAFKKGGGRRRVPLDKILNRSR